MSEYLLLLKKELRSMFSIKGKFTKNTDYLGMFLSLVLTVSITALIVFVYRELLVVYTSIRIEGSIVPMDRFNELLSLTFGIIIIINIFSGVKKINREILEGSDFVILVRLPLKPQSIFLSKLSALFINQVIITTLTLLPIIITSGIVLELAMGFWLRSILMIIIIPLISLMIASLIAIPYNYIIRFLRSKFILLTGCFVILLAGFFLVYIRVLELIETLLLGGNLDNLFNAQNTKVIQTIANHIFPANFCARFVSGNNAFLNLAILMIIALIALGVSIFIINKILNKVMKSGMEGKGNLTFRRKSIIKKASTKMNFIKKEFIMVLRTPNYAFQYIATSLTLPLMVYSSLMLFYAFLVDMLGMNVAVNSKFELSVFIIAIFTILTNTFCASNISREGYMFNIEKTLPCSYKDIVFSKIIFCSIASVTVIFISCLIALLTNFLSLTQFCTVFIATVLLSLSEIFFATRKDLNKPKFANNENNEITQSTQTISFIIVFGLLTVSLMGGLTLFISLLEEFKDIISSFIQNKFPENGIIQTIFNFIGQNSNWLSVAIIFGFAIIIFGLALLYLLKGLSKRFYNTVNN